MSSEPSVRVIELAPEGEELDAALSDIREVVASGQYVLGARGETLERSLGRAIGVDHVVAVGSGTDALIGGLDALGIGAGDEVIVPAFGAFPTVAAVISAGATPVLVDVEPDRPLIDLEAALRARTPRTRAVVVVHLYGLIVDLTPWRDAFDPLGISVIEDAAQAQGGSDREGRPAGSRGAFGVLSFYPTKNLGALGDGGAIATNDRAVAEHVRRWRNHGVEDGVHHLAVGNSRLDEIQATWLIRRLARLDDEVARRRTMSERYARDLPPPLRYVAHDDLDAPHLAVVRTPHRLELAGFLAERGIETGCHYPVALRAQPALAALAPSASPHADHWASTCLSLPFHLALTDRDQGRVIEAAEAWVRRGGPDR